MKKKTIMLGLFAANLILFLLYSMLSFCVYPEACVQKDKITLTVKWKEQMEHTAYIDRLYAIADEIGGDLMLSVMTGDYVNQYYRTEKDPSFIPIEGLQPGVRYSTDPKAGEEKIKGFFFLPDSDFRIAPLRTLEDMDIDLSVQAILIRSDRKKLFRNQQKNMVWSLFAMDTAAQVKLRSKDSIWQWQRLLFFSSSLWCSMPFPVPRICS